MICDDVQLALSTAEGPLPAGLDAHLQGCAACGAFAADLREVLGLAALPEPSAAERAKIATLPVAALAALRAGDRRRGRRREIARLAIAAGLGALVASAAWAWAAPRRTEVVERLVPAPAVVATVPALSGLDWALVADEPNLSDDEVFSEVSWNPEAEGALP